MKVSYKWLRQYIETDLTPEEMASVLTDIGLEIEGFEKTETVRGGLSGVVVGRVLTCEKHPDADKLKLTTVDLGDAVPTQIVCGAPNVAAGQKVLVATIGCTLYPQGEENGIKIKKSKIRGVESNGMICAEDELGLGDSHEGIMVLPDDAVPGTPARDLLGIEDDYTFEIGLTPNRIDAASHYGVARDLAAWLKANGRPVTLRLPEAPEIEKEAEGKAIAVEVKDSEAAPRYMGVTVSGVRVGPSPEWLQNRLRSIGLNPHNNIVDITNYILHSVGQPLHAFDADRIEGGRIVVRTTEAGTPFTTLDGTERKLSESDLMICRAEKPICIAGVLGGLDPGVTEATVNVFLESAYFNPVSVRKTAKHHGLNTDSSFRFERGIDPDMTPYALRRAARLIQEVAGGKITSGVVDIYPEKVLPFPVEVSYANIDRLVGKEIPREKIREILRALDIRIVRETYEGLSLEVPPFRVDVRREADVIEEILRIYGYNNVEIPLHVNSTLSYGQRPDRDKMVNIVADYLTANGFNEIMSNSLTKSAYYENNGVWKAENAVRILNPLSNDLNVMRQTLLYNMLEAAQLNANRKNGDLKCYEFGNCYFYCPERAAEDKPLAAYREEYRLAMLVTGKEHTENWNVKASPSDFFTLKKTAEQLLKRFGMDIYEARTESLANEIYREGLRYVLRGKPLFEMGVLTKKLRNAFDLKTEACYLEMNFDTLLKLLRNQTVRVKDLAKYPEVRRDLALLVDSGVTFDRLRQLAFATEKKLLKNVGLFDVYEGDKLPEGKKSYALSFVLQDSERTMTDEATDRIMNRLIERFEKEAGAQVRK